MIPRRSARNVLLMALTVSSGVVDAISFIAMGKVFTAFMTGNLVFLGLGAANAFAPHGPEVPRVAVVIAGFAFGVFAAERILRRLGPRGLGLSAALTGVLVAQVVFMTGWMAVSGHPSDAFTTCLAAIAALAMGMQSCAVGSLDVKAVYTTAVTATLINLSREAADPGVSATEPPQLAAVLVCLVVGATVGGLLLVHARPFAPVVPPLATGLAIALAISERRALRARADVDLVVATNGNGAGAVAREETAVPREETAVPVAELANEG